MVMPSELVGAGGASAATSAFDLGPAYAKIATEAKRQADDLGGVDREQLLRVGVDELTTRAQAEGRALDPATARGMLERGDPSFWRRLDNVGDGLTDAIKAATPIAGGTAEGAGDQVKAPAKETNGPGGKPAPTDSGYVASMVSRKLGERDSFCSIYKNPSAGDIGRLLKELAERRRAEMSSELFRQMDAQADTPLAKQMMAQRREALESNYVRTLTAENGDLYVFSMELLHDIVWTHLKREGLAVGDRIRGTGTIRDGKLVMDKPEGPDSSGEPKPRT
jgi:hypothetical protein